MRRLILLVMLLSWSVGATTFTEFYCDTSNGSTNINAGSTTNSAPVYIALNGNWDGTSVYTPTDGSTPASTVSAGMWAAIFVDGSTNLVQSSAGGCVMLITNVAAGANGAITFDRAAFMGTAPSSSATGRSIRVGGCWNGPYRTIGFPFGFAANTGTNGASDTVRINLRNTAQYNITAVMTHANAGPVRFQGMTATPGDLGKATIDGGATGTSFILLTLSGNGNALSDLIFSNNGNAGSANLVNLSGNNNDIVRVVVHDAYRSGFASPGNNNFTECEAYLCNKENALATHGGFNISGSANLLRCVARNNNKEGIYASTSFKLQNSISYSNTLDGVFMNFGGNNATVINCNFYGNGGAGIRIVDANPSSLYAENCAFFANTAFGITNSSQARSGGVINCVFGSGTAANGGATIANIGGLNELGTITYTADQTPWIDPVNGDFRLVASATLVKAAGRGSFTQSTVNSPTNTVSYPDIGAAQSSSLAGPTLNSIRANNLRTAP